MSVRDSFMERRAVLASQAQLGASRKLRKEAETRLHERLRKGRLMECFLLTPQDWDSSLKITKI